MISGPFISIGSKGTSLPTELRELEPPLLIGPNGIAINGINWSRGAFEELGKRANGWVSEAKKSDPFEIYPLRQAIAEKRIVHFPQIKWVSENQEFEGEAFFPANWKPGDSQPSYVAVRAPGWKHGCIERDWNVHNQGKWVGVFHLMSIKKSAAPNLNKIGPRAWTRDELVIGMNLYCTMPFGQLHERNPKIIQLAEKLGRTPGSVAMKLCNFASLDPVHQARGVKGLSGASQGDREVWKEFHQDWDQMGFESEVLLAKTQGVPVEKLVGIEEEELPREGKERERIVKQRVNQCFFRSTVLAAYGKQCCVTGLDIPELLVACHIVPWCVDKANRVNPRNGVCMNALHDKAFDRGLMTFTSKYRIQLSNRVKQAKDSHAKFWLMDFDGAPIRMPERFLPEPEFVAWHRKNIFKPD